MLTLRVYRVRPDGSRTPTLSRTTVTDPPRTATTAIRQAYPPCRCPRCREAAP